MTVSCYIHIDGEPDGPRTQFKFAYLPRSGDFVILWWDEQKGVNAQFKVRAVSHVADGMEYSPMGTYLYLTPYKGFL